MFSKIDNFLIILTQWCVRQIELYTSLNRKTILLWTVNITRVTTSVLMIVFILLLTFSPAVSIIGLSSCYMIFQHMEMTLVHARKQNTSGALPVEIINNKNLRIFLLLIIPFTELLSFGLFLNNKDPLMVTFPLIVISKIFYVFLYIEYLLCTTSLPPGEKERKQIEKEMSSLVPIKIRN